VVFANLENTTCDGVQLAEYRSWSRRGSVVQLAEYRSQSIGRGRGRRVSVVVVVVVVVSFQIFVVFVVSSVVSAKNLTRSAKNGKRTIVSHKKKERMFHKNRFWSNPLERLQHKSFFAFRP